ncbi:MAG: DinB family protein [Chloroflexi bacterium]|nr:DinB family protein [Chloroflexota bacterium]
MDIRDVLIDGISQLNEWLDDNIKDLTPEQFNWRPDGKMVSAAFAAWHVVRTQDNVNNFVFQRKNPVWIEGGYVEKFGLPKVEQGTGMTLADAQALRIDDIGLFREYNAAVAKEVTTFLKSVSLEWLEEIQMVRPLGEMPKWKVFRQVLMTHGFMHLGEINALKGMQGMQFSI